MYKIFTVLSIALSVLILAFIDREVAGKLLVTSAFDGRFDIYTLEQSSGLFVSKKAGRFNVPLGLRSGEYVLIADCSHQNIHITAGETTTVSSRRIRFHPPVSAGEQDYFRIRCSQHAQKNLNQTLKNRFYIDIIDDSQEVMLGLKPFSLKQVTQLSSTPVVDIPLAALRVSTPNVLESFYIALEQPYTTLTQAQPFGFWIFLQAGLYRLSLNGTSLVKKMAAGDAATIEPALLKVSSSAPMGGSPATFDRPQIRVNKQAELEFQREHYIFAGEHTLHLPANLKPKKFMASPGERLSFSPRSLTVRIGCRATEWECIAKKEVFLFEKSQSFPFVTGVTDHPLFFFEQEADFTIEGAAGMHFVLGQSHDVEVVAGEARFHPEASLRGHMVTDLVRVEKVKMGPLGFSHDIALTHYTSMTLPVGVYLLKRYSSDVTGNYTTQSTPIRIKSGETQKVPFTYYTNKAKHLVVERPLSRQERYPVL